MLFVYPDTVRATVLMGRGEAIFFKIHRFHILTSPLERKFHTDSKNDLKKLKAGLNLNRYRKKYRPLGRWES